MTQLHLSHLKHVALLVDTSESALPYWDTIRQAALAVYTNLKSYTLPRIYVIGCDQPATPADLDNHQAAGGAPRGPRCSLLGPTLRALTRRRVPIQALIAIGNGEIFDLADWVDHPLIERWALVRAGPQSLQGDGGMLPEIETGRIDDLYPLLGRPSRLKAWPANGRPRWSNDLQQWSIDSAGYPLIWAPPIGAYVHLFPITKAQFERYIAASGLPAMGDVWYADLLKLNRRASVPGDMHATYEQLLATGITPDEVLQFAKWLGPGYGLLEAEQWRACYEWLDSQPATAAPPALDSCAADARLFWERIDLACMPKSMLDLALMAQGVIEWVALRRVGATVQYGGVGRTRPAFAPILRPNVFEAIIPHQPRMGHFGARLQLRGM